MKFLQRGILIFALAFFVILSVVEGSPAQTTVCSGDSVVLVMNGYMQGSTSWQQSSNRTTWSNAQGTDYNDSLVITATNTYYYRAIVIEGTCSPFYSDTVQVIVNPTPPVAKPASGIHSDNFTTNWSAVTGATDYFIDISADPNFITCLLGKKNIDVGSTDTTYYIDGLVCHTPYYYRVRAFDINCGDTGTISVNSNTITVTTDTCPVPYYCTYKSTCNGNITDTRDNKTYTIVQIGTQCWMAQNLNVGTMIMGALQQTQGLDNQDTSIEKYCYSDLAANCTTYGGLYLWDEMMAYGPSVAGNGKGPQGICPIGWHLPTDNEWKCLEMSLGMSETQADAVGKRGTIEGNKLKTNGNGDPPLWQSPSAGTDTSGFTALPGGYHGLGGSVGSIGRAGNWWEATEYDATYAWYRGLNYNYTLTGRYKDTFKASGGFSVRCVKD